jgi:hypothetical protein
MLKLNMNKTTNDEKIMMHACISVQRGNPYLCELLGELVLIEESMLLEPI